MPPKTAATARVLSRTSYDELVDDLSALLQAGRREAERAVSEQLVRTYHAVGQRVLAERLSQRAGYGSAMLERLATDIGLNPRVLQQAVAFAKAYDTLPETLPLRWTHYRELMRLPGLAERRWYERQAAKQGWNRRKLAEAIRSDRFSATKRSKSARKQRGVQLERPTAATFVYKGEVLRVVDGDTLIVAIDLGFEVLKRQRIRLAGIDAPGPKARGGQAAADFVRDLLARVAFVVVKTTKLDIYGRYVGHVFYSIGETESARVFAEGRYLNQQLVDAGHAKPL